jgi:molecular chaperone DnaK
MTFIGIDLGTTNSAICSFDGESVRLYKSPEQQDVTPSAIFIDKRGNKYVGSRAYNNAARSPDTCKDRPSASFELHGDKTPQLQIYPFP